MYTKWISIIAALVSLSDPISPTDANERDSNQVENYIEPDLALQEPERFSGKRIELLGRLVEASNRYSELVLLIPGGRYALISGSSELKEQIGQNVRIDGEIVPVDLNSLNLPVAVPHTRIVGSRSPCWLGTGDNPILGLSGASLASYRERPSEPGGNRIALWDIIFTPSKYKDKTVVVRACIQSQKRSDIDHMPIVKRTEGTWVKGEAFGQEILVETKQEIEEGDLGRVAIVQGRVFLVSYEEYSQWDKSTIKEFSMIPPKVGHKVMILDSKVNFLQRPG